MQKYDYDITSTSRFIENCAIAGYQIVLGMLHINQDCVTRGYQYFTKR